jgi:hypothetical protein
MHVPLGSQVQKAGQFPGVALLLLGQGSGYLELLLQLRYQAPDHHVHLLDIWVCMGVWGYVRHYLSQHKYTNTDSDSTITTHITILSQLTFMDCLEQPTACQNTNASVTDLDFSIDRSLRCSQLLSRADLPVPDSPFISRGCRASNMPCSSQKMSSLLKSSIVNSGLDSREG